MLCLLPSCVNVTPVMPFVYNSELHLTLSFLLPFKLTAFTSPSLNMFSMLSSCPPLPLQVAVRRGTRMRVPALWWVSYQLEEWWAASSRVALSFHATARPAAPVWLEAAGQAGRARRCSTTAATSSWAACSLSSASQSLPVSSPKKRRWPHPPVPLAPLPVGPAPLPAPPPPLPLHHPALPQSAAPPARMRPKQRLSHPTKCPFCAPPLSHSPHRKHPFFVLHLPSHNEGKAAQLVGQQGKCLFFHF